MPKKTLPPKLKTRPSLKKITHIKRHVIFHNNIKQHEIAMIKKILEQTPDMREDKVKAIKKAISTGTYRVNTKTIAERMIKESLFDLYVQIANRR
jgi:flagellar biosynthesis anti-sigma factor FlgM